MQSISTALQELRTTIWGSSRLRVLTTNLRRLLPPLSRSTRRTTLSRTTKRGALRGLQTCIPLRACQSQIANIDSASTNINIFQLSTVAATKQLSVNGQGVIDQADNINGFASTATFWSNQ